MMVAKKIASERNRLLKMLRHGYGASENRSFDREVVVALEDEGVISIRSEAARKAGRIYATQVALTNYGAA